MRMFMLLLLISAYVAFAYVCSHSMLRRNMSKWRLGDDNVRQSVSEIASKTKEVLHIKKFEKYCVNAAQEEQLL